MMENIMSQQCLGGPHWLMGCFIRLVIESNSKAMTFDMTSLKLVGLLQVVFPFWRTLSKNTRGCIDLAGALVALERRRLGWLYVFMLRIHG